MGEGVLLCKYGSERRGKLGCFDIQMGKDGGKAAIGACLRYGGASCGHEDVFRQKGTMAADHLKARFFGRKFPCVERIGGSICTSSGSLRSAAVSSPWSVPFVSARYVGVGCLRGRSSVHPAPQRMRYPLSRHFEISASRTWRADRDFGKIFPSSRSKAETSFF